MKQSKLFIISLVLNALVFLLVITGIIIMLTVGSGPLADRSIFVFKYFTFQSNVFVGVVSFVYAYYQLLIILGKKSKLPHVLLVFNHVGVTAVSLTFLIVVAFLAPGYGYDKMYIGANLFFHALVPLVAIINYLFFEKEAKISFKNTLFCLLPCALYGTVYKYEIEPDRSKAIKLSINMAKEGDTVLIAGKGHEDYQIFADRTIHFDDCEHARNAVIEREGK